MLCWLLVGLLDTSGCPAGAEAEARGARAVGRRWPPGKAGGAEWRRQAADRTSGGQQARAADCSQHSKGDDSLIFF